jgi:hypothetical protein
MYFAPQRRVLDWRMFEEPRKGRHRAKSRAQDILFA